MKFVSWNVNGLRACIGKGFLDRFNELNADFFCLQETKLSEGQLQLDIPGYQQFWCYAEKKGYSGTAIFTKHTPLSVSYGIGVQELDNEGRVITLEYPEFYLVTCYTPNAQRGLARLDHRMVWDEAFRAYLKKLDEIKPVIICGDLNVAHQEIDLKNPKSNRGNAGFSDEERASFQNTLDTGFVDTFRHLYPDVTGRYSWWSYMYHARENNAGWRIDYFLVSDRLKDAVSQADIHSDIMGSDHCPVSLDLNVTVNGGIWSPEPMGKATVVDTAEKANKAPKASAESAKALVTFGVILLLLAGSIPGLSYLLGHRFAAEYVDFTVKVYYLPFWDARSSDSFLIITNASNADIPDSDDDSALSVVAITDGISTYNTYISDSDKESLSASNIAIRILLPEEAEALDTQWNITLTSRTQIIDDLHIEPYYEDPTLKLHQGWLIWGRLDAESEFRLTVSSDSVAEPYITSVNLVPYITPGEANEMTTGELASYIANHDYLYQLAVEEGKAQDLFTIISYKGFPAFHYFYDLPGAVSALMNLECDGDAATLIQALLSTDAFRSLMTPEEEAAFLTNQCPSCFAEDLYSEVALDYSSTPTEDLLTEVLSGSSVIGAVMDKCTSRESAALVYEFYAKHKQILAELESRDDTAALLYSHVRSDFNKIAAYLLTLDIYSTQLSEAELTKLYSAVMEHSVDLFVCMLGENPDKDTIRLLSTEQLVTYLVNSATLCSRIEECVFVTDFASADVKYQAVHSAYPLLQELQSRDDMIQVLLNSPCAGGSTIVSELLELQAYRSKMTPREEADYITMQYANSNGTFTYPNTWWEVDTLTTDQLVRFLYSIDINLLLQCRSTESAEYVHEFLLDYSQPLAELQTRDDAVYALMNYSPIENSFITHCLLSLKVYQQKMTEDEMTAYLNQDYPTYPKLICG